MNKENEIIDAELVNNEPTVTNNVLEQNDIHYKLPDPPDYIVNNNYYIHKDEPEIINYGKSEDVKNKQKALLIGGTVLTLIGLVLILTSVIEGQDQNVVRNNP